MLKTLSTFRISQLAITVAATLLGSASANAIVYSGSFVADGFHSVGSGSMTATYTITTDGTLGILGPANFTGYTLSIDYNGTIRNSSGSAALFVFGTGTSATASALSFDFGGFENALVFFDGNDGLCFLSLPYGCVGEQSPVTTVFSAPLSAFGIRTPREGVEVIATAAVVPEPASWAMLIAGFGLTGAVMRQRRAATA